jgi:SAM-dependent methyltransferase
MIGINKSNICFIIFRYYYEWFKGYDQLGSLLEKHIPKDSSILHLGCGNSHLSSQMYEHGWLDQTNIDYSSTVIENMSREFTNLKWICGDIFSMNSLLEKKYDVAIDKGTLDALLTVKHDPWNPDLELRQHIRNYIDQIVSSLAPNGIYIHITWSQPHFRKIFLSHPCLDVQVNKLCSESDSFEYFIYICKKT